MVRRAIREAGVRRPPGPSWFRRKTLAWLSCAVVAAAAVGLAASRGGGESGKPKSVTRANMPACASSGKAVDRPTEIPGNLLPPGTVLTWSRSRDHGRVAVAGVISREFRKAVEFFVTKLPAAGYRNIDGDAEMDEAEAVFTGGGVTGRWKVNGILNCPHAVTLTLFVTR